MSSVLCTCAAPRVVIHANEHRDQSLLLRYSLSPQERMEYIKMTFRTKLIQIFFPSNTSEEKKKAALISHNPFIQQIK